MFNKENLIDMIRMLYQTMGSDTEIILSDTKSILYVENALDPKHQIDAPLPDRERYFLTNPPETAAAYVANYRSVMYGHNRIRSSTLFVRDENGQIQYMLSINTCVDPLVSMAHKLELMINGETGTVKLPPAPKPPEEDIQKVETSVAEIINGVIEEGLQRFNTTATRLTTKEKQSIMRELDKRGVFVMKGAVTEVAKALSASEVTIYRYLKQLQ